MREGPQPAGTADTRSSMAEEAHLSRRGRWLLLAVVLLVTTSVYSFGIAIWQWDMDELYSLRALGRLDPSITGNAPRDPLQVRMPRLIPVWYAAQDLLLRIVPSTEWGTRLLSTFCGIATVCAWFVFGLRRRGLLFALALALLLNGSQWFVWTSQQNRYYSTAVLFCSLTIIAAWSETSGIGMVLLTALLAALAVLSHSLTAAVFAMGLAVAVVAFPWGWTSKRTLGRIAVACAVAVAIYLLHSRPLTGRWTGTEAGVPWGLPLLSMIAKAGVPTMALSAVGIAMGLLTAADRRFVAWWGGLAVASLVFLVLTPLLMPIWSIRYGLLLLVPFWITAAYAVEFVARRLRRPALVVAWFGFVAVLLAPKMLSHFRDGSRYDFREAAHVVAAELRPGQHAYCDFNLDRAMCLRYYLPRPMRSRVSPWYATLGHLGLPPDECLAVHGAAAWDPPPQFDGRSTQILAKITRRRFDEQSYVVWVFRVIAVRAAPAGERGERASAGRDGAGRPAERRAATEDGKAGHGS